MRNMFLSIFTLLLLLLQSISQSGSCPCKNVLNGRDGRDGIPGRDGRDCVSNATTSGRRGPEGPPGRPGTNGVNGAPGKPGAKGPQGNKGLDGQSGSSIDRNEIEKLIKEELAKSGTGAGGGIQGSITSTSVCDSVSKDVCGECKCRDKKYADEFFSRGYYCDCQKIIPKRDCLDHLENGSKVDGIYVIKPGFEEDDSHSFPVWCDMNTDGGGWVVFQKRFDNRVDFQRDWFSYKNGFGNLQHEFWLGLENLFLIQIYDDRKGSELRMDFVNQDDKQYVEKYGVFELGDESEKYKMSLSGYHGDAKDCLKYSNNMKFSTYDNDNDKSGANYAKTYGPFWHGSSSRYNPNNVFKFVKKKSAGTVNPEVQAIYMRAENTYKYITRIEMKIRRK